MRRLGAGTAIIAVLLLTRLAVAADEIRVMTSGAFAAAYLELAREFLREGQLAKLREELVEAI